MEFFLPNTQPFPCWVYPRQTTERPYRLSSVPTLLAARSFLDALFFFHERDNLAKVVHNGFEFGNSFRSEVLWLR